MESIITLEFNDGIHQPVKYNKRNNFVSCNKVIIYKSELVVEFYSSNGLLLDTQTVSKEFISKIISYFESKKNLYLKFGE